MYQVECVSRAWIEWISSNGLACPSDNIHCDNSRSVYNHVHVNTHSHSYTHTRTHTRAHTHALTHTGAHSVPAFCVVTADVVVVVVVFSSGSVKGTTWARPSRSCLWLCSWVAMPTGSTTLFICTWPLKIRMSSINKKKRKASEVEEMVPVVMAR